VPSWPLSLYNRAAEEVDRRVGWDKLPKPVAMAVLIGLRNVLREWTPWRGRSLDLALALFSLALLTLGLRAVFAVFTA